RQRSRKEEAHQQCGDRRQLPDDAFHRTAKHRVHENDEREKVVPHERLPALWGNEDGESVRELRPGFKRPRPALENGGRSIVNGGKTGKDQSFEGGQGEFWHDFLPSHDLVSKMRSFRAHLRKGVSIFEGIS